MRKLPRPSLQTIREITDYYEKKASGDYESLSTRYLFLMIQELRHVLNVLEGRSTNGGFRDATTARNGSNEAVYQGAADASTIVTQSTDDTDTSISARLRFWNNRPWCERSCAYNSHSSSVEELRDAVEYLEENLDAANQHIGVIQQSCEEQLKAQASSFRKIIADERAQFEGLYGRMKEKCDAELKRSKQETDIIRRDAQAVMAMVQRESHENICAVKADHAKVIDELTQKHNQSVESLKAEHSSSKERTAELLAAARRDQKKAVDKARQELIRKHESEIINMRREATAAKASKVSKDYEKETVLGPDGVELLARIIQNKENARDVLLNSLFERQQKRCPSASRKCSKRYRG